MRTLREKNASRPVAHRAIAALLSAALGRCAPAADASHDGGDAARAPGADARGDTPAPSIDAATPPGLDADPPDADLPDAAAPDADAASPLDTPGARETSPPDASPPPPDAPRADGSGGLPSGTLYYVAPGGDDARSCATARNPATPRRTVRAGITCLAPGATVVLRAGTYAEEVSYAHVPGGTGWDAPATIMAYPGERVVLRPSSGADRVFTFVYPSEQYIVIDGLVLDAANATYDAVKITYTGTDPTATAHHIRFQNCEVMNAPAQGLLVDGHDDEFIALRVHQNGTTDFHHGFYVTGQRNLVERCDVYANAGWGIHFYDGARGMSDGNTARYNTVHENARVGHRGVGIGIYSGSGSQAHHNVVWGNADGIWVDYGTTGVVVYQNTVVANRGTCIGLGGGSTGTSVRNNLCWMNGAAIDDAGRGTVLGRNLTDMDPLFVAPAAHDYHLRPGSPAIDAGELIPGVPFSGRAPDLGALETP